jgi:hypothetical protein
MLARSAAHSLRVVEVPEDNRLDASSLQSRGLLLPPDKRRDLQLLDGIVLGGEETGEDGSAAAGCIYQYTVEELNCSIIRTTLTCIRLRR